MAKGGTTMILMACNVFRYCTLLRGLGSLMVLLVLAIVALTYYALVVISYAPLFFSASSSLAQSACSLLVLLIFHFLLVMLLWSYFSVVLTDPGGVPPNWKPVTDEERGEVLPLTAIEHGSSGVDSESAMVLIESLHPKVRYCRKCNQWKPPRCHHCSVCGRCILKMDHHCVWVVNCVGARNYKFFLLFLFYTFLETALVTLSLLPQFIAFFGDEEIPGTPGSLATTFIGFVLNLAFALSVLGFLIMHISLVARNTTTIEAYEKKTTPKWKYDLGRRKNFEQVFGTNKIYWFIPLYCDEDMRKMPALNGFDYPSKPDMDTLQL